VGGNAADDYFLTSHGVATPEACWKLMVRGKDRVIAWSMPNRPEATPARVDASLVTVQAFEARTGEPFPKVPDAAKGETPAVSWLGPLACDRGSGRQRWGIGQRP
jgi:endonuclease G